MRGKLFLPERLYEQVIEVDERVGADGTMLEPINIEKTRSQLQASYASGIRSCAIVLMHGYRFHEHEQHVAELAQEMSASP